MPSNTEENYLKAIFTLNQNKVGASTNAIAEKLETKASSVSDMLKRLKEKKLIHYEKYQAVSLSKEGKKVAISIIRKHRLWEYFLVEKLAFKWNEVHEIAEQLEHIESTALTEKLDKYLGYPKIDPHGDPIPDKNGNFPLALNKTLDECLPKSSAVIIGVKDHSSEFLSYLDQHFLELGTTIFIKSINSFDKSAEITINNQQHITISHEVAKNLYINSEQ